MCLSDPPPPAGQSADPRRAADPLGPELHPQQGPAVQLARGHALGRQLHLRPSLLPGDLSPARPRLPQLPGAALQGEALCVTVSQSVCLLCRLIRVEFPGRHAKWLMLHIVSLPPSVLVILLSLTVLYPLPLHLLFLLLYMLCSSLSHSPYFLFPQLLSASTPISPLHLPFTILSPPTSTSPLSHLPSSHPPPHTHTLLFLFPFFHTPSLSHLH